MALDDRFHCGYSFVGYTVSVLSLRSQISAASLFNTFLVAAHACFGGGVALYTRNTNCGDGIPAGFLSCFYCSFAAHGGHSLVIEAYKAQNLIGFYVGVNRNDRNFRICDLGCNRLGLQRCNDHCIRAACTQYGFDNGELFVICGLRGRTLYINLNAEVLAGLLAALGYIGPVLGSQRFQNNGDMRILGRSACTVTAVRR